MFGKCSTFQPRVPAAIYGEEHLETRLKTIQGLVDIHEGHPKVCTVEFLVDVWKRMNYDSVDACLEGYVVITRIPPHLAPRETKFPD